MKELKKLANVKSIITILLTIVFCILVIFKTIPQEFLTIYTTVIAFYFGTQYEKKNAENADK